MPNREKLKVLYDQSCNQISALRWEIVVGYAEAPELRDYLLNKINGCYENLKLMYKSLSGRLTAQTALNSLRDLQTYCVDLSLSSKEALMEIITEVIGILGKMMQKVPGHSYISDLHDTAHKLLIQLKDLLVGETGICTAVKRKLVYQIDTAQDWLSAVKDRMVKSQSLYLAMDHLDEIEEKVAAMYRSAVRLIERRHRDEIEHLQIQWKKQYNNGSGNNNSNSGGPGSGNSTVTGNNDRNSSRDSSKNQGQSSPNINNNSRALTSGLAHLEYKYSRILENLESGRDKYVYLIQVTRDRLLSFQLELLVVNEYSVLRLKSMYEGCFSSLQELMEHDFINNPDLNYDSFTIEDIESLHITITNIGDLLQDTVTRNHLTSTFFSSTAKYMVSLVSIRKALQTINNIKSKIISLIPFNEQIGEYMEKFYQAIAKIFMFDKIRGLLPIDFVSELFYTAYDAMNDLRVAVYNTIVNIIGRSVDGVKTGVNLCINGTLNVLDAGIKGVINIKDFLFEQMSLAVFLIYDAQRAFIVGCGRFALDCAITFDKYTELTQWLQLFLQQAKKIDQKTLALEDKVVTPVVKTVVSTAVSVDKKITGGFVKEGVTNVMEEYVIRGGKLIRI